MKSDPEAFLKSAEFAAFVQRGGAEVTPATLHRLAALLPELRAKFPEVQAPGFPAAPAQLAFLALVVEAAAADTFRDVSYGAISEAAFALLYLAREVDIIPDIVEDIGYLDDAAVAGMVLQRHAAEFGKISAHLGGDWESIDPAR